MTTSNGLSDTQGIPHYEIYNLRIFTIDEPVSSSTPGNKYVGQVVHEAKYHINAPSEETAIPDKSNITSQPSSSQTTESILTPELSISISDDQTMEGNINPYISLF